MREGGFAYDLGPHRFHTTSGEILDFVRTLPGLELKELQRVSRIRLMDRYFDYPLSLGNVLSRMPLHRSAGMLLSFMGEKVRGIFLPREQESFEGWVLSRFGRQLYNLYLAPYNRKLWGMEPSGLSADWASQRITVPSLAGLIKETVFPSRKKVRSLVSTFHYPRGGIGSIALSLAEAIESSGGRILCGTVPKAIENRDGGWSVAIDGESLQATNIINTIPVGDYADLLGERLPKGTREAARKLRFRSLVFLAVRLKGEVKHRDHWIYTSEDRYLFNRLSISGNFDSEAPPQVVFEFSCTEGDDLWNASGDELMRGAVPSAEHLGLFRKEDVTEYMISREAHAYPIYDLDYASSTAKVLNELDRLPGAVTCGRQGLFRYNNMDHSIEMGRCAAMETLGEGTVKERFDWDSVKWADG